MTKTRSTATGDRCRVHTVLCAGLLLVFMAGHPALAQPGTELEIGGGYHAALDLGSNFFTVPSTATVDVRATNWVSDRWGVAARALVGLGGHLRSPAGVERRHPTYFQMLVRYRAVGSGRSGVHVGFGGGLMGYSERDRFDCCGFHLLGLEALGSRALTDRLSIRFGASLVVPLHVHPLVLLAWRL